jgi:Cu(I)/Ag(I) efflux system membrane fusion protein
MSLVPEEATEADKVDHSKHEHIMHEPTEDKSKSLVTSPSPQPSPQRGEGETKVIYTCPIHPQIRESRPGSCPICGMDLVPVKPQGALPESNVPGFASIKINPTQQWLIGVKTAPVKRENLTRRLRTFGTVAYDPKLYVAQKEFLEAIKTGRASGSRSFVEASRRKLMLLGMTPKQIDALARKGVIDESLFLTEGTGKAWVYSVIYESERPLLREGLNVEARSVGHPQMKYEGKIDAIIPVVDPKNRTIRVRSAVADPINMLQPDMFMDVFIEIPLGKTLTVPKSAVLQTGLRNIALVSKGNGIFEPHEVMLGNQSDEKIQIISGLEEGETVVTSANFLLDSESQLRSAFNAALGGHEHDH